jgi:phosphatidylglycerophosphatase A
MHRNIPPSYLKNPLHLVALGFGSGLAPKAPGTFGTLAAIPLYLLLSLLSLNAYLIALLIITIIGVYVCAYTSRSLGVHDHPGIVIDEFVGLLITMIAIPVSWQWLLTGFILFRFFDIIKPWPISWLDKYVHGGLGIMLDDIVAGLFSLAIMHIILYVI